jgi:hypothetical protein
MLSVIFIETLDCRYWECSEMTETGNVRSWNAIFRKQEFDLLRFPFLLAFD